MQLRVFTEPQQGATYDDLLRVAKATEELGFDAFFRSDHYLDTDGRSGEPGSTDAWLTLAALARDTSRIRLGTLVSPVTFRLPGPLAISAAQVDVMSGGRVEIGLGAGWYEAEHRAYGIPYPANSERFDRFVEQVEIIHGLLTTPAGKRFDYAGTYYQIENSPALPKPVRQPRPPIILGGEGRRRGAELAATYADEFNAAFRPLDETEAILGRVRAAATKTGRELVYSAAQILCVGSDDAQYAQRAKAIGHDAEQLRNDSALAGTVAEVLDKIASWRNIGISRFYMQTLDLSDLDHLELVASEIAPQL